MRGIKHEDAEHENVIKRFQEVIKLHPNFPFTFFPSKGAIHLSRLCNHIKFVEHFSIFQTSSSAIQGIIGSLSNYDDDHNDDFKKTIGLRIKTTALHVHHAF